MGYVVQFIAQGILERGTVGYLVQRPAVQDGAERTTTLLVQLGAGLIVGLAIVLAAAPVGTGLRMPGLLLLLPAVALSVAFYALRAVPMGDLERAFRYRSVGLVEATDILAFNSIAVLGVAVGWGFGALIVGTALRSCVSCGAAFVLSGSRYALRLTRQPLRELATYALPFTAANALTWLNTAAAPVLVGGLLGARELGTIQIAYQLIVYPQALTAIVGRIALPTYSRLETDSHLLGPSVSRITSRLIRYAGLGTMIFAISSVAWVPWLLGSEWAQVPEVMITIAPAYALAAALVVVIAALNARGHATAVFLVTAVFTSAYWAGALVLVPLLGSLGLPIAFTIATPAYIAYLVLGRKLLGSIVITRALIEFLTGVCIVAGVGVITAKGGPSVPVTVVGCIAMIAILIPHFPYGRSFFRRRRINL